MSSPMSVRLHSDIQAMVASLGAPHTVARALILLGLASANVDVSPFERDIRRLLAEPFEPALLTALRGLVERTTPVVRPYYVAEQEPHGSIDAVDDRDEAEGFDGFDV